MDHNLLTVEEVAERLSVSTETVRRYLREGRLRGVKLIRAWRIQPEELERFIAREQANEEPHE